MACNYQPRRCVGPSERRCFQLLGGIVGSECCGTAISPKDGAFASSANALQEHMGNRSCAAAVVHLPINRTYQDHGYGSGRGSCCYSVALCDSQLHEKAWRSMEMSSLERLPRLAKKLKPFVDQEKQLEIAQ